MLVPAMLICCGMLPSAIPPGTGVSEYEAKAAFLYNLVKFVEWPAEAISGTSFNLCVAEPDPFGDLLPVFMRQKQVSGRAVQVMRVRTTGESQSCHVLFVSRREPRRVAGVLREVHRQPVLTLGETADFSETGGMMTLLLVSGKIQLHINTEAVRASNLRVSAQLLRFAQNGKDAAK